MDNTNHVEKLMTYVFVNEAPLPVVEHLDLSDGLYLAPLSPFLLRADTDFHLMAIRPGFSQFFRDHLHKTTLNVTYVGRNDLNYESVESDEASSKRKVETYLLSAMIHTPAFLAPYASVASVPSEDRICHSDLMKDFGRFPASEHNLLSESDFADIGRLYILLKDVLVDEKVGRLPTAIRYYQQAFRSDIDRSVRFLGLMMAMEALFGHGTTAIAHQVSERTAFFLKQSPEDREDVYRSMKRHYALRSKIAHGGTPDDGRESLDASLCHLLHSLRDSLLRIMNDSLVSRLFRSGSSDQFNRAMQCLVFHGAIPIDS